ncbi:VOC family protein [Paenibacillus sp. 7516]|uniref:VOC family protein n=1 Tax=Paenibacillus sp. 7516 TaxID=2022549 RepID=UPI000BA739C9|nr:VOC family protein [Paenibacillus sp. 7516]PAF28936.1 glyoxalase [Paenibacillus sp. 7516]
MTTRGIDHIGITVPDVEQATVFLQQAFGARLVYDNITPQDPPQEGPEAERKLGLRPGAKATHIRMLSVGESASIELFQFGNTEQNDPARASDFGVQHVALYVDQMENAVKRFTEAGGELLSEPSALSGPIEGGEGNQFVYGRAPWGMLIELISYPAGIDYPQHSEDQRWTPKAGRTD